MFETLGEKAEEKAMVQFLERFTDYPFLVKFKNSEYPIGEGEPTFTVNFKETIPLAELLKSTSLALGEAYMRGDLDIEGNLYEALDHFLGQMSKFSTNESALKKIMFSSTSKKNQEKEVTSHYDIGNDFYKLWLDETMSYSTNVGIKFLSELIAHKFHHFVFDAVSFRILCYLFHFRAMFAEFFVMLFVGASSTSSILGQ